MNGGSTSQGTQLAERCAEKRILVWSSSSLSNGSSRPKPTP